MCYRYVIFIRNMFISLFVKRNNCMSVTEPYYIIGFLVMYFVEQKLNFFKDYKILKIASFRIVKLESNLTNLLTFYRNTGDEIRLESFFTHFKQQHYEEPFCSVCCVIFKKKKHKHTT